MKSFEDWPQPINLKGRGLRLHEFWWYMYSLMCADSKGFMPKLSASSIVSFNKNFYHLKETFGLTAQDMKAAIYFAYMTNPLGLEYPCEYGDFSVFRNTLPSFVKWYNSLEFKGDLNKVFAEINKESKKSSGRDSTVDNLLSEFMSAMQEAD